MQLFYEAPQKYQKSPVSYADLPLFSIKKMEHPAGRGMSLTFPESPHTKITALKP